MIILVSQSPRRQEILTRLKIPFVTETSPYEEILHQTMTSRRLVSQLARGKVEAYLRQNKTPPHRVLGADTLLSFQGSSLGKPSDRKGAKEMLENLKGHTHFVLTSLCLYDPVTTQFRQNITSTKVIFRDFSPQELEEYLDTGEWAGAAGAYRIQETGERLVKGISGCYSNVVGLPIPALYAILS